MSEHASRVRIPRPAAVLWPIAVLTFAHTVFAALDAPYSIDFGVIYRGATRFLSGHPVYSESSYVFTPSGTLLTAPLGWLSHDSAHVLVVLLGAVCVPVAGVLALRLMDRPWTGAWGAAVLLGLAVSETVTHTLAFGNINTLLALLEVAALLLQLQRRDLASGTVLGLALALKPVMGLLLLIPLLARRWRAFGAAVAVAVVLNVVGYAAAPFQRDFITDTLPRLFQARPEFNSSLWAAGVFVGANPVVISVLRLAVVALAVVVLWHQRHEPDERLWLGVVSGTLLLVTLLAPSLSETYWSVLLLPLLLTVARPSSPMHSWVAWAGAYLFLSLDVWIPRHHVRLGQDVQHLEAVTGWGLVLVVTAVWAARRSRLSPAPPATTVPPLRSSGAAPAPPPPPVLRDPPLSGRRS